MRDKKRTLAVISLVFFLLLSCRVWSAAPPRLQVGAEPGVESPLVRPVQKTRPATELIIATKTALSIVDPPDLPQPMPDGVEVKLGDPAGCLSLEVQANLTTGMDLLRYADSLIILDRPLRERILPGAWNGYTQRYEYDSNNAIALAVVDVKNEYLLQRMLNALHVAGFVTWLRDGARPDQDLHILAVPLLMGKGHQDNWAPYIQAYWQGPQSTPEGDPYVRSALKLPPCTWMVSSGFAPQVDAGWWAQNKTGWPDYASVAQAYL
ncbi:MAG: hypothetical protein IH586_15960, partial [Anaerolineaceae bacterium]|nr:hypothetical protein [Anaerolineaceae bacterium]